MPLHTDVVENAKGVAVMLEHAKVDSVMNFLLVIKEYNIDLLSINSRNITGTTALHVAAAYNAMSVLEYLVTEVCVNIDACDNWNRTPLDEATRNGHDDIVRYLHAAGAKHGSNIDWGYSMDVNNGASCTDMNHLHHSNGSASNPSQQGRYAKDVSVVYPCAPNTLLKGLSSNSDLVAGAQNRNGSLVEFGSNVVECKPINGDDVPAPVKIAQDNDSVYKERRAAGEMNGGGRGGGAALDQSPSQVKNPNVVSSFNPQGVYFLPDGTAEWELLSWDVEVYDVIGEGAFGEIRSGKWRGSPVAIKTLKSDCMTDEIALREFNCELSIWCRLVHPNIVQFLGVGHKRDHPPIMVCEFMGGGSLQQKLLELNGWGKKLSFDKAFKIGSNIAAAMHYMHSRRPYAVIHRDLKPANILLTMSGTAKVADFGLSKMFDISTPRTPVGDADETSSPSRYDARPMKVSKETTASYDEQVYSQLYSHTFLMTGETGAYKYMAPEVFRHEFYGLKCDVFSFAMVLYELFEGLMPISDPIKWAHKVAGKEKLRPGWMFMVGVVRAHSRMTQPIS